MAIWSDFFKLFSYARKNPMGATSVTGVGSGGGALGAFVPAPGKTIMSLAFDEDLLRDIRDMARIKQVSVNALMEAMARKYLAENGTVQDYVPPSSGKARSILDDWEVTQDASS